MNTLFLLSGNTANGSPNSIMPILLMVLLFGAMYFFTIRPQKKKQKEEQEMRDAIQIGDEITTIGGIIGRVVTVKEDSIVVETGADRVKMKLQRWAIQTNETANARIEEEKKAAEEAKKAKSEQDAIDAAVNGRRPKKTKKVKNKGSLEEFSASEQEENVESENKTEE